MKEGKGILKYLNGDIFDGYFKNDAPYGSGILTLSDGRVLQGIWIKEFFQPVIQI